MANTNNTITLVPVAEFKWTAEIQYKESLPSRDAAIRYAGMHGWNLIVMYDRRTGPLFDVMHDPNLVASESEEHAETTETVSVVFDPEPAGLGTRMARGVFGLFSRRLATAASTVPAH
jgi:hypothetical protein